MPPQWGRNGAFPSIVKLQRLCTLTTTAGDLELLGEAIGGGTYDDLIDHTIDVTLFGYDAK